MIAAQTPKFIEKPAAADLQDLSTDEITNEESSETKDSTDSPSKGMKIQWNVIGSSYLIAPVTNQIPVLPVAVYHVKASPTGLFLERLKDKFEFPFRMYGIERDFINRMVKTYNGTNSNLGVLLNGIKGTGKTVTAEVICNELKLPVILVNQDFGNGLVEFLNSIQQNVIVFFDEYEKVFPTARGSDSKLLTIMDGALKNNHRKVFIMTTNQLSVEDNLLQRPGRVRYLKRFGNLPLETIIEIVDDKLIHKARRKDLIHFISRLELITVDIVSNVIQEVNIHDEDTEKFSPVFNVKQLVEKLDVYEVVMFEGRERESFVKGSLPMVNYYPMGDDHIGGHLAFTSQHSGYIKAIKEDGFLLVLEKNDEVLVKDENGHPKKNAEGDYVYETVKTPHTYRMHKAYVYNDMFGNRFDYEA